MTENKNTPAIKKVAIIGSGPSGLTAAIYTSRASLQTTIFTGEQLGGQLTTTTEIENFPGAWNQEKRSGIMGPELMATIQAQAENFGTKIVYESIVKITRNTDQSENQAENKDGQPENKRKFTLTTQYDSSEEFDAVIICTGASARYLGIEDESRWIGRGYHTCATCDGFFYKNKTIAVVGGGDSAMEEATYLSGLAEKVYLIHRSDSFRASPIMQDRVKNNPKIEILPFKSVKSFIIEAEKFEGVELLDLQTNQVSELRISGLFVAIGHIPNSGFIKDQLTMDEAGYLITRRNLLPAKLAMGEKIEANWDTYGSMSEIEGIFIAGDVEDKVYRQAITAAGDGCRAAIEAQRWLEL